MHYSPYSCDNSTHSWSSMSFMYGRSMNSWRCSKVGRRKPLISTLWNGLVGHSLLLANVWDCEITCWWGLTRKIFQAKNIFILFVCCRINCCVVEHKRCVLIIRADTKFQDMFCILTKPGIQDTTTYNGYQYMVTLQSTYMELPLIHNLTTLKHTSFVESCTWQPSPHILPPYWFT